MMNTAGSSGEMDKKDYKGLFLQVCKKKLKERLKPLRLCFSSLSSHPPRTKRDQNPPWTTEGLQTAAKAGRNKPPSLQVQLEPRCPLGFQLQIQNKGNVSFNPPNHLLISSQQNSELPHPAAAANKRDLVI